jgi:hypothetical protein
MFAQIDSAGSGIGLAASQGAFPLKLKFSVGEISCQIIAAPMISLARLYFPNVKKHCKLFLFLCAVKLTH